MRSQALPGKMRNVEGGSLQKHARLDSVSQPTLESGQLVFERLVDATHKRRRNVYNRRAWRIHIEPRTNPGQIGGHNLAAARKSLDHQQRYLETKAERICLRADTPAPNPSAKACRETPRRKRNERRAQQFRHILRGRYALLQGKASDAATNPRCGAHLPDAPFQ